MSTLLGAWVLKELYNTREKCTVAKLLLPKSTELRNLAQGFSSVDFGFTKSEDHGSAVRFSLCFVEDLLSLFSKGFHSFLFYFWKTIRKHLDEKRDERRKRRKFEFEVLHFTWIWEGKISTNGFGCLALVGTLGLGLGLGLYSYSYSYNSSGFLLSTWFSGRLAELYKLNGCFFFSCCVFDLTTSHSCKF